MMRKKSRNQETYPHDALLNILSNKTSPQAIIEAITLYERSTSQPSSEAVIKKYFNTSLLVQSDAQFALKSRVKRAEDDETLVGAIEKGKDTYWLSQEDIGDIARLVYNNYEGSAESHTEFEILGSIAHLDSKISTFQLKAKELVTARLTLIIHLANKHWVTLIVSYKDSHYVGYYVDSKGDPIPHEYYQLILDQFQIQPISLSPGFPQQRDDYNCGLWALENADDLNRMLEENQSLYWILNQLQRPRDTSYFAARRQLFAENLRTDPVWQERHALLEPGFNQEESLPSLSIISPANIDSSETDSKRFKGSQTQEEKVTMLLGVFVEAFMAGVTKRLVIYHLVAKAEKLTTEAVQTELKKGLAGALLGTVISQSMVGSLPSWVASIRMLSSNYYLSKTKAQRITKMFFDNVAPGDLGSILSEAAAAIFHSFESQFMQVTDKAGDKLAMEKLAEDAVERAFNYIAKYPNRDTLLSAKLIEEGVLQGPSERFFDPNFKKVRLLTSGTTIQDKATQTSINTANLYKNIGLLERANNHVDKLFVLRGRPHSNQYGYRRLLDWEKEANNALKEILRERYNEYFPQKESLFQVSSRNYNYFLNPETYQSEALCILAKVEDRYPPQGLNREYSKPPIFFDLKKSIKSFTGRIAVLNELHRSLISEKTVAVVPALSSMSLLDSDSSQAASGAPFAISGLGGIGKTQLALRYAALYAGNYDNNVLWINAETKENFADSFYKLATKVGLATRDRYSQKKELEEIVAEVYEYFSDRKSLFIFDNAENYRAIEFFLPKALVGNKPTVLITSRYTHWENIATVLKLDIFTEQEAETLIKQTLHLRDESQEGMIKELNKLLQGLPLALQQALAYIKLRKSTDTRFSLHDYVELYKAKTEELLNFDFSYYSNDPYVKSVFTTVVISLDKLKTYPIGPMAIEILNIMAYLDPENISGRNFFYLRYISNYPEDYDEKAILLFLENHSLINLGSQENKYTIHRLVQQVIRINLGNHPEQFEIVVKQSQRLFIYYDFINEGDMFHYIHFMLYMLEYKELKHIVFIFHLEELLFNKIALLHENYWSYFIDLAYFNFPKQKFLNFIGDASAYCIKSALFSSLSEMLNFIEKKWHAGIFSKENIKYVLEHIDNLPDSSFQIAPVSRIILKREKQRNALELIYEFKQKLFGDSLVAYELCRSHSLKRSTTLCVLPETEQAKIAELKDQNFKSHFKKVAQLSRYMNSGLMTKNILSALLHGDFAEVAVSFELITGSILAGEISNGLLTQGKKLALDGSLLERDLGLANKNALHILLSEEVLSVGKRQFLGKVMQAASPFVARVPSIFFAYNLNNEIKLYKMGDETVLPAIIANGVMVSIDGIVAGIEGAEFLEIITGISEFTGPVGEGITLLTWLGVEGWHVKQQVEAIEKYARLILREIVVQGVRAFFNLPPSEYLQIKVNNNKLIQRAIEFLKTHTEIKHYIFPSFHSTTLYENSKVFLDKKRAVVLDSDSNPDEPNEGHLFCSPVAPYFEESSYASETTRSHYFCQHTLGVEYTFNRTGDVSLFSLGEGDDEIVAFSDSPALFHVHNGKKKYIGSDKGNVFTLEGNSITGLLKGGNESDLLTLDNFNPKESDYLLIDAHGFLCGKNSSDSLSIQLFCRAEKSLKLDEINRIYGRKNKQDIVYPKWDTYFFDGYGGRDKEHPDSFFITQYSYRKPSVVLRNNSLVCMLLNTNVDSVTYLLPAEEAGEARIEFSFTEAIQHRLFFEHFLQDINAMTIKRNSINISLAALACENVDRKNFTITISDPYSVTSGNQTEDSGEPAKNISYFFQDMEIKLLNNQRLYAQEIIANNKTVDEKISLFIELANRLDKTFSIQLINNTTISIGSGKHEVFYTNGLFESHLVGNGGENVYIILPGNATEFPLREVTLYDILKENLNNLIELTDTLDLREINKKAKQICPDAVISPNLFPAANDIILILNSHRCHFRSLISIRFKNAFLTNWYQKLGIVWEDSIYRNIVAIDDDNLTLAESLVISDKKKIIMITDKDIGESAEILVLRNIGNYNFYRIGADLILTNLLTAAHDYCTFICCQFYQLPEMKKKILSARFRFFDQTIYPKDYQAEIDHAIELSDVVSSLNSTSTVSPDSAQELLQEVLPRSKRKADREEKIVSIVSAVLPKKPIRNFDEESHILAIEDDYLKKYKAPYLKNKRYSGKKKASVLTSAQKNNFGSILENNHQFYAKNNGNYLIKRTASSQSKNLLRKESFSKPEAINQKEKFFKDTRSDDKKIISFVNAARSVCPKEDSRSAPKAPLPRLTYQQNESGSKKANHRPLSRIEEQPDLHGTLMLLQLVTWKALGKTPAPFSFGGIKSMKKVEKNIDLNSNIFRLPK